MHYQAHLAQLLAMQKDMRHRPSSQQWPPATILPDNGRQSRNGWSGGNALPATILPDNGSQSRNGEPGAGPAPGQQYPGGAPKKRNTLQGYAPVLSPYKVPQAYEQQDYDPFGNRNPPREMDLNIDIDRGWARQYDYLFRGENRQERASRASREEPLPFVPGWGMQRPYGDFGEQLPRRHHRRMPKVHYRDQSHEVPFSVNPYPWPPKVSDHYPGSWIE